MQSTSNNVVNLKEFRTKAIKELCSTDDSKLDFVFNMNKVCEFTLNFIREHEAQLSDNDILDALQFTFDSLKNDYNEFKIIL